MSFPAIQDFHQKFAHSADLRRQIKAVKSLPEMMALLQSWDIHLTRDELQTLAQNSFETWLASLNPLTQAFFLQARQDKALNIAVESCKAANDVVRLARSYGYHLTETDLAEAAQAANQIQGFSFEKIWFKHLGLLPS
ncbi:MAG: Nif11-like leader peptide family natural product precursor [Prochlorotrichaceae cyanobacterium]